MEEANALVSLAALVAFICLFYGPWQAVCTDVARQLIFEKRDALFDLARSGSLDFASPEYKAVRQMMEGMIRYSHELTWIRLYSYRGLYIKYHRPEPPIAHFINSIRDPITKEKVETLLNECILILIGMMAAKSIWTAPLATVLAVYVFCTHGLKALVLQMNGLVRRLAGTIQWGVECGNQG